MAFETIGAAGAQTLTLNVDASLTSREWQLWKTDQTESFIHMGVQSLIDGKLTLELAPDSVYSLTTTTGQTKGVKQAPASQKFQIPYSDDFESYAIGRTPRYFSDQAGTFEVIQRADGQGKALEQVLRAPGIEWENRPEQFHPFTLIGAPDAKDYLVSVDVEAADGVTVALISRYGRIQHSESSAFAKGYRFEVTAGSGAWKLSKPDGILAQGTSPFPANTWHNLQLEARGTTLICRINGTVVAQTQDSTDIEGLAGLAAGYAGARFDNIQLSNFDGAYRWGGGNGTWVDTCATGWSGGPPASGDRATINTGTVTATGNNQQAGVALTIGSNGVLNDGGNYIYFGPSGSLTLNGGTIHITRPDIGFGWYAASLSPVVNASSGSSSITGSGGIRLEGDTTFTGDCNLAISHGLHNYTDGYGYFPATSITKTGSGTLTLSGVNDYTGPTIVLGGTLRLGDGSSNSNLADSANVSLAATARLHLDFNGTDTVNALSVGGVAKPPGVYSSSNSDFITGPGTLTVLNTQASDYDSWKSPHNLAGGPDDDDDSDGLSNFEEYAFGLDPMNGQSVQPVVNPPDRATGIVGYTRRRPALKGLSYSVWFSTDLHGWEQPKAGLPSTARLSTCPSTCPATCLPNRCYSSRFGRAEASMMSRFLIRLPFYFPKSAAFAAASFLLAASGMAAEALPKPGETKNFTIGKEDFLLDGKRIQIRCGEIHAARVPREYWQHRLRMCKAMGLNTVCAYLFWNMHEPEEGQFNWSDRADIAEFCRLAAAEGLWVILRPGPYACAEWEMGGTPWWLLRKAPIELRSRDPKFMEPAKRYLREVGRVLAPLQVSRGGPILMVQVENEYGFYGEDADYVREVRQAVIDAGFDVPLFDCNPTYRLGIGSPPELFHVVNFGSNPDEGFDKLRQLQPEGPLMCGEFYPGWFDTWGNPHNKGNVENYLRDLETMLKRNGSFSIYMAHGGTTFGLWAGCDRPFKPDTSSYDYDAPISEAGWATDKFHRTRELFSKYLLPGETLPDIPAPLPVISFPAVRPLDAAPVLDNLPAPQQDEVPRNIETYGLGYGCMLYRTKVPAGEAAPLEAARVADFGYVYLDGKSVGVLDRRRPNSRFIIPARSKEAILDILIHPMGRVNFGREMNDPKGLQGPVKLGGTELKNWEIFPMPLGDQRPSNLKFAAKKPAGPAYWRLNFEVEEPGDTFLDLRGWGKGILWLNGRCLGRFWNIGPTQTAYAPGCWMKKGANEIIILDFTGPSEPTVAGLKTPILDQLRPELDFGARRSAVTVTLPAAIHSGEFAAGTGVQDVKFAQPASGRYFCLESIDAHDGGAYAAVAELDLLGSDGKPLSRSSWTIAYVSSEERNGEDGSAENAIDGQTANFWHSEWKNQSPAHPHRLVIDLGKSADITGFRYTPRQSNGGGRIRHFKVYTGDSLVRPIDP